MLFVHRLYVETFADLDGDAANSPGLFSGLMMSRNLGARSACWVSAAVPDDETRRW